MVWPESKNNPAPKMSSGKSLLADVIGLIATGKVNCAISHAENEAEEKNAF